MYLLSLFHSFLKLSVSNCNVTRCQKIAIILYKFSLDYYLKKITDIIFFYNEAWANCFHFQTKFAISSFNSKLRNNCNNTLNLTKIDKDIICQSLTERDKLRCNLGQFRRI